MAQQYRIEMAIDLGTWNSCMTYTICDKNGKRNRQNPVLPVMISDQYEVRTMAAYVDDRLVYGVKLQTLLRRTPNLIDRVVEMFKLCLYPDAKTRKIGDRVSRLLAELPEEKTLENLISDFLKAIVADAREAISESDQQAGLEKKQFLALPYRVRVTVPQMWTPSARRSVQAAAKSAGFPIVVLASEPQCALAYLIDRIAAQQVILTEKMCKGNVILVADLGSGTGDFAMYRLLSNLSPDSRLEAVQESSGELCGSFQVEVHLLEALKLQQGPEWQKKVATKLGFAEDDFDHRALLALEKMKREFNGAEYYYGSGEIRVIGAPYESFQLGGTAFRAAFEPPFLEITKCIDGLIAKTKPNLIEVTGGFSRSGYLMQKLKDRYKPLGIIVVRPDVAAGVDSFPVAMGALLRYDNITSQNLPSKYDYAVLQREVFDDKVHTDSWE